MSEPDPSVSTIAEVTDPFGIFTDIMLRPGRFFAQASEDHLMEGAKVGVICAVLGFLGGAVTSFAANFGASMAQGAPLDSSTLWTLPVSLVIIVISLAAIFWIAVGAARLLGGRGNTRDHVLAFACSLTPTIVWVVPFLGPLVAPVYQAIVFGRGLSRADSISVARGQVAAFTALAAALFLFVAALVVLVGTSTM